MTRLQPRAHRRSEINGLDFEAVALRGYFQSLPAAHYSREQCIAALTAETKDWCEKIYGPGFYPGDPYDRNA